MELTPSFLQTPAWEEFQKSQNRPTFRLKDTLYIQHHLRFGQSYWYAPRVDAIPTADELDAVFKGKASWVVIEPQFTTAEKPFIESPSKQPRQTYLTNLTQSLDVIQSKMKSKTRYNIRVAERKGVQTFSYQYPESLQYLPYFLQLTHETNLRNQIKSHPDSYYQKMMDVLGRAGMATLHVAYQEQQPISALILVRHAGTATYLFGASATSDRETMGTYLLQWTAMQYAKSLGDTVYDWWGVRVDDEMAVGRLDVDDANRNQVMPAPGKSYGVTRFKLGFGGIVHFYPPAYTRSYKPFWYTVYKTLHRGGSGFSY